MTLRLNFTLLILITLIILSYYICKIFLYNKIGGNIKTLFKVEHISTGPYPINKKTILTSPTQTDAPVNICELSNDEYNLSEKNIIYHLYENNNNFNLCDKILLKNQLDFNFNGIYKVVSIKSDYIELKKIFDTNNIISYNSIKFLDFFTELRSDVKWTILNDNKYYKKNNLILKSNSDKNYIDKNIVSIKNWYDSSNNFLKNSMINDILYNKSKNHIFTFNNNKYFNINLENKDKLKSIILVLHNIYENINIIDTNNQLCNLKLLNNNCITTGINKIVINNEIIDINSNFYDKIYNKPIILYLEFEFDLPNININKHIDYNTNCNGYIYEIRCFKNYLDNNNCTNLIKYLNYKWNVYLNNLNNYTVLNNVNMNNINTTLSSTIGLFDGLLINKNTVIENLDKNIDYIKKQLILDNKVILVDVASTKHIILNYNLIDSEDSLQHYNITQTIIDNITLKDNFIIFLKNQNNNNENGIYLYNEVLKQLIKQDYIINDIKDKYFSIIYGKINKNTYWRIDKDSQDKQKIFKDNLFIENKINPINLNFFQDTNLINPYAYKCNILQEDEDMICSNNKPCNYNNIQGCILLNNNIPINLNYASTENIKIDNIQHNDNQNRCLDIQSLNLYNNCGIDSEDLETNSYYKLNTNLIDSYELKCNQFILLKNQTNLDENGIYKTIKIMPENKQILLNHCNNYIIFINNIYKKIKNNNINITLNILTKLFDLEYNSTTQKYRNINIYNEIQYRELYFKVLNKQLNNYDKPEIVVSHLLNYQSSISSNLLKNKLQFVISKFKNYIKNIKTNSYWIINKINIEHNMNSVSCKIKEIINDSNLTKNVINFDTVVLYINSGQFNKNKLFKIKKIGSSINVIEDRFTGGLGLSQSTEIMGLKEDIDFKTLFIGEIFHPILGVSNLSKKTIKTLFNPTTGLIWKNTDNIFEKIDTTITNNLDKYSRKNIITDDYTKLLNINNYINI